MTIKNVFLAGAAITFVGGISLMVSAFVPMNLPNRVLQTQRTRSFLSMGLTPVGPLCPFRPLASTEQLSPTTTTTPSTNRPELASEMARLQMDIQMGNTPDKDRLLSVSGGIDDAVHLWEQLLTRLERSGDFQTMEYVTLTEAHLETHGVTPRGIASMMKWQSACLKALALDRPPPMPPQELDLNKMMAQSKPNRPSPSMTAMAAAVKVTATPLGENCPIFDTPTVKKDYIKLCRDHANLIEMGSKYTNFDAAGKLAYLDAVAMIGDRWDAFFVASRNYDNYLDQAFAKQCHDFLTSMSLNEEDYRVILKKAHGMMRADAEKERDRLTY